MQKVENISVFITEPFNNMPGGKIDSATYLPNGS